MRIPDRNSLRIILVICVCLAVHFASPGVSPGQSDDAREDSVETRPVRVESLQDRIRMLEERLEEALKQSDQDSAADSQAWSQSDLASLREEVESLKSTLEGQQDRISRVRFSGEERIRFMNIDTEGDSALGAYGETLEQETTFKHYLRLDTRVTISPNLTAGVRLRVTNVDKTILDEGPEYLSREYGSAFLQYARKEFNATVGAYDIYLTPLTLMRWDQEDNPDGGGEAAGGCLPCGGIAGAIPSGSLEELSPRLTYEGARLNGMVGDVTDVTAFYARPRYNPGTEMYRQHLFGARAKILNYHQSSSSFRHVGLSILTSRDEASSLILKPTESLRRKQPPAIENDVAGLDLHFPFFKGFLVEGEAVYSETRVDSVVGGHDSYDGYGLILGVKSQYPENLKLRCSYLRLDGDFESTYRAVSYFTNLHGFRAAGTLEIPRWNSSVSAFAKVLQEIDPAQPDTICEWYGRQTIYTASLGLSVVPATNVLVRPSVIYRKTRRDAEKTEGGIEEHSVLLAAEFIYTLFKDNEFTVRYQYIDTDNEVSPPLDHNAGTFFTLFSLKF